MLCNFEKDICERCNKKEICKFIEVYSKLYDDTIRFVSANMDEVEGSFPLFKVYLECTKYYKE